MANDTTKRVWRADTAGVLCTDPITVSRMTWRPGAADQVLDLQDKWGSPIWYLTAIAASPAGDERWEAGPVTFDGLTVITIGGGTLDITIKAYRDLVM